MCGQRYRFKDHLSPLMVFVQIQRNPYCPDDISTESQLIRFSTAFHTQKVLGDKAKGRGQSIWHKPRKAEYFNLITAQKRHHNCLMLQILRN